MLLSKFNIQDLVTEQINLYLSESQPTFEEFKALIINKTPVPEVQTKIVQILTDSKKSNLNEVKERLEKQACQNQIKEDDNQKKLDQAEAYKDRELKENWTSELDDIPTKLSDYETTCRSLRSKIARLIEAQIRVQVTHHHEIKQNGLKSQATDVDYSRSIERLRASIDEYEVKIQTLIERKDTISSKLSELKQKAEDRLERQNSRVSRHEAREGYTTSGEGVMRTLSSMNQTKLSRNIQNQDKALETKCDELILEAEDMNYPFFLEQLQKHLIDTKLTDMQLKDQEIEALHTILKLMKQHFNYELQSVTTRRSLNNKRNSISEQLIKLEGYHSKLRSLGKTHPDLTSTNKRLAENNIALKTSLEHNSKLRQRLSTPTLLLFALTLVAVIPFILTIKGVIPFFIAPALLLSLVGALPALLLISTLTVGIAALVYSFKTHSNTTAIATNVQTIEHNTNEMKRDKKELKTLQNVTVPTLESQIKKDEATRDNLIISLDDSIKLAKQTFDQAIKIVPASYSVSTLLVSTDSTTSSTDKSSTNKGASQEEIDLNDSGNHSMTSVV